MALAAAVVIEESGSKAFFPALESLRGIAALGVTLVHAVWTHSFYQAGLIQNAWLFVDMFFVLSGFVMSSAYADGLAGKGAVKAFALRRFFRLYPLHLATLVLFVAAHLALVFVLGRDPQSNGFTAANEPFLQQVLANLTLTHAAGVTPSTGLNGPSWSISGEAFAYAVFALVAASPLWRRGRAFAFAGLAALGYFMVSWISPLDGLFATHDAGIWRALFGFSIGVLTFIWLPRAKALLDGQQDIAAGAQTIGLVGAFLFITSYGIGDAVTSLAPFLFAFLVLALAAAPDAIPARLLSAPPLVWLGTVSYSIYMLHYPIAIGLNEALNIVFGDEKIGHLGFTYSVVPLWVGNLALVAYWVTVLVASALCYRLLEEPARRFGRALSEKSQ